MGKLRSIITGKLVAFDRAPLIYYLEEHPAYLSVADELFDAIDGGMALGMTSVLTLLEVLVKPLREGLQDLASQYRELLTNAVGITLHPIDEPVCERTAQLRAKYDWLRTPDALQVATAIQHGADVIVTNDERWKRLTEIEAVIMKDYMPAQA